MAGPAIRVEGAKRLHDTLVAAGASLDDLKRVNAAIASMLVPYIAAAAPRRSGRLAGTVRGSGTKTSAVTRTGSSRVPYARPIHWGWPARHIRSQPFAWNVVNDREPVWRGMYEDEIEDVIDSVKGA